MLATSLILVGGFSVFASAMMKNVQVVGVITAFIIAVAFLADILLVPAILRIRYGAKAE